MGRRGPAPAPDNVKELRGRTSHTPKATQAVKPPPSAPNPPTWLSTEARAEWRRVVPQLDRLGVLATIDRAVLTAYCSAWAKFVDAEAALNVSPAKKARVGGDRLNGRTKQPDQGLVISDRDGDLRKHPGWQIYREAAQLVCQISKELYLTPVARLRVTKPEDPDGDEDDVID